MFLSGLARVLMRGFLGKKFLLKFGKNLLSLFSLIRAGDTREMKRTKAISSWEELIDFSEADKANY